MATIPQPAHHSAPNFGPLARPYRYLEYLTFGSSLQNTRIHFLPELLASRHALILGDGDGRFTAALLQANPQVQVHAVDASPRMLHSLCKNSAANRDRLTTQVSDIRTFQPDPNSAYDLVATHFFLDCLNTEDISALAKRIKPALTTRAQWVNSEFAVPHTLFGQLIARPIIRLLYLGFRLLTRLKVSSLPDYNRALQSQGWTLNAEKPRLKGLLTSQIWSA